MSIGPSLWPRHYQGVRLFGRMIWAIALGCGGLSGGLSARTLTIGVQLEAAAIDPHFSMSNPSVSVARHLFDTLAHPDERQRLRPGLALSWSAVGPSEWEFRLRPGVTFHDGAAFTAEDVAFSLARAPNVPNAPSGFGVMTRQITGIRVVDPLTIRLTTAAPFPLMAEHLSAVAIVSRAAAEGAQTADFNGGRAAVGTGPYRFVSWMRAGDLRLARNDAYWGSVPAWGHVMIRPIPDDTARAAALLSGTVDVIDQLSGTVGALLRTRADMHVAATPSNRIIFLGVNVSAAANNFITDHDGKALGRNPLADARVRRALSKAINREALAGRVMEGLAVPAGQLLPDGYPGTSPRLRPEPHDPNGARALLAEAGYPNGFQLTLQVPREMIPAAVQMGGAIAQMLTRIGVRTDVEAMPLSMFRTRYMRAEFAVGLRSWGTETGEGGMALRSILGTRDAARGWGMVNGGLYSNPAADRLLERALATIEAPAREAMVAEATELALDDVGIIPLYYAMAAWGMRRGITYTARSDGYSFAWEFRPTGP